MRQLAVAVLVLASTRLAAGQELCQGLTVYSPCDMVFELNREEQATHAQPHLSVNLSAEFRSPRHRTIALPAFWDGGGRMVIRFSPMVAGEWAYRLTSNVARLDKTEGKLTALDAAVPGFVRPANGHHWMSTGNQQPHLWVGDNAHRLGWLEDGAFNMAVEGWREAEFNHVRGYAIGGANGVPPTFTSADLPDLAFYQRLDRRLRLLNDRGLFFDAILGLENDHLVRLFPTPARRERYLRYLVARYAAFHVTWQVLENFETYTDGRVLLKELGESVKRLDPYEHPRSTGALITSSPLAADGWMDHILYQSADSNLGAIEHQLYAMPAVSLRFTEPGADATMFRRRLWNAAMDGQYPSDTGSSNGAAMKVWRDLTSTTRYWELEPYFDLDGGRALALPGVEYLVYVEKPTSPIEVRLEKHGYDVRWINPATGEVIVAKGFNAERQVFEVPSRDHDWLLQIARDGRKEGMLRSYKFESRQFLLQEVETSATKVPIAIAEPAANELSVSRPQTFEAKTKRDSRGTRSMLYLWTGEVAARPHGMRVTGSGAKGVLQIPKEFAPGTMHLRLFALNAYGKLYSIDRVVQVVP